MQEQAAQEREVQYRQWDSDDAVRLRDYAIKADVGSQVVIKAGTYQKLCVVLGVKKAPWFSDVVGDDGLSDSVFNKRMNVEFKKMPQERFDEVFVEVQKINATKIDLEELKKKLQAS